jgi:hypothetical protein
VPSVNFTIFCLTLAFVSFASQYTAFKKEYLRALQNRVFVGVDADKSVVVGNEESLPTFGLEGEGRRKLVTNGGGNKQCDSGKAELHSELVKELKVLKVVGAGIVVVEVTVL